MSGGRGSGGRGSGGGGMSGGIGGGGWVPKIPSNCEIVSPKDGPAPPAPTLLGPGMLTVTLIVNVGFNVT